MGWQEMGQHSNIAITTQAQLCSFRDAKKQFDALWRLNTKTWKQHGRNSIIE
jgi:hypothetical protein